MVLAVVLSFTSAGDTTAIIKQSKAQKTNSLKKRVLPETDLETDGEIMREITRESTRVHEQYRQAQAEDQRLSAKLASVLDGSFDKKAETERFAQEEQEYAKMLSTYQKQHQMRKRIDQEERIYKQEQEMQSILDQIQRRYRSAESAEPRVQAKHKVTSRYRQLQCVWWIELAAKQRHTEAQRLLGWMHAAKRVAGLNKTLGATILG